MSHRERRPVAIFAVAILAVTPCLWAGTFPAASRPPGYSAAATHLLASAAQAWRALVAYWLPLATRAASADHGSSDGGIGSGLKPSCDSGATIDPDGRCVGGSVRRPVPAPACDAGPSIDPNGGCPGH